MKRGRYNVPLLVFFLFLLSWKFVRMDWIVIWPRVSCDPSPWARIGPYNETYRPPVSPAWKVPRLSHMGREYSSWEKAIPIEFSHFDGPTGPARIRPDWLLMIFKIGFLFTLMASPAILRTLRGYSWAIPACGLRVTGYLRELIEESRRQHRVGN